MNTSPNETPTFSTNFLRYGVFFAARHPLSCEARKNLGAVREKERLQIDVDGSGPLAPFNVTCEYYGKNIMFLCYILCIFYLFHF